MSEQCLHISRGLEVHRFFECNQSHLDANNLPQILLEFVVLSDNIEVLDQLCSLLQMDPTVPYRVYGSDVVDVEGNLAEMCLHFGPMECLEILLERDYTLIAEQ